MVLVNVAVKAGEPPGFASLPRCLTLNIFARLPADARLLLALVCPSWRALVAEPSLWACVDLSQASGVTRTSDALLLACSATARGGMRSLDVCGRVWTAVHRGFPRPPRSRDICAQVVLRTARENASSLRHLRALCPGFDSDVDKGLCTWRFVNAGAEGKLVDNLLLLAPGLTCVEVDLNATASEASGVLRNEALRVRSLVVSDGQLPPSKFFCLTQRRMCR